MIDQKSKNGNAYIYIYVYIRQIKPLTECKAHMRCHVYFRNVYITSMTKREDLSQGRLEKGSSEERDDKKKKKINVCSVRFLLQRGRKLDYRDVSYLIYNCIECEGDKTKKIALAIKKFFFFLLCHESISISS